MYGVQHPPQINSNKPMTNKQFTSLCLKFNSEYTPFLLKSREEGWDDVRTVQEEDRIFDKYIKVLSENYKNVDRAWEKFWTTANQLAK